jgi:hypothetical protein
MAGRGLLALWRLHRAGSRPRRLSHFAGSLTTRGGFAAICEIEFGLNSLQIERLAILGDCDSISVMRVNT